MVVNPVLHALNIIRAPFYYGPSVLWSDSQYQISLAVTVLWAAAALLLSMRRVEKRDRGIKSA